MKINGLYVMAKSATTLISFGTQCQNTVLRSLLYIGLCLHFRANAELKHFFSKFSVINLEGLLTKVIDI